ncbi:hypothetical protein [Thiomicrorhabdus arctica]|uniref:hypothetical protein n=1 Tax=Thiomicrorhabdus arctica TaxID=131540 RepID=UPI000380DD36|nr:hypothetical protein [Thiomicrorhabdus arctica]
MKTKIILLTFIVLLVGGCSSVEFLGAQKWSMVGGLYVERWFLEPSENFETPKGTAAEKVKHHYIVKYYIAARNGEPSVTQIPTEHMWQVKHNGKPDYKQDDDDLFFYIKTTSGLFKQHWAISDNMLMPIKACYNSWCELYPTVYPETLYVKQAILYQE